MPRELQELRGRDWGAWALKEDFLEEKMSELSQMRKGGKSIQEKGRAGAKPQR